MTDTTPPAPPQAPILHDQWGRPYVPRHPIPGLIAAPVTGLELVELWRLNVQAAAFCAAEGRSDEWAHYTQRAHHLLSMARDYNPILVRMFEQPPHYRQRGKGLSLDVRYWSLPQFVHASRACVRARGMRHKCRL